jgi:hypothetical protein
MRIVFSMWALDLPHAHEGRLGRKVLTIDDNRDAAASLAAIVAGWGCAVSVAEGARSTLFFSIESALRKSSNILWATAAKQPLVRKFLEFYWKRRSGLSLSEPEVRAIRLEDYESAALTI